VVTVVLIGFTQGEETEYLLYNTTENSDCEHETGVKSLYIKRKKKVN